MKKSYCLEWLFNREAGWIDHVPDIFDTLTVGIAGHLVFEEVVQGIAAEYRLFGSVFAGDCSEISCVNSAGWSDLWSVVSRPLCYAAPFTSTLFDTVLSEPVQGHSFGVGQVVADVLLFNDLDRVVVGERSGRKKGGQHYCHKDERCFFHDNLLLVVNEVLFGRNWCLQNFFCRYIRMLVDFGC